MNERQKTIAQINRHEQWLATFDAPALNADVLTRVKAAVRAVCEADASTKPDPAVTPALRKTKIAVRRELATSGAAAAPPTIVFRPWAPVLAAAAALAFAFVTLWSESNRSPAATPELNAFVETMTRDLDDTDQSLAEIETELAALDRDMSGGDDGPWSDDFTQIGDAIDALISENGISNDAL